jgi:hypothetical protein
MVPNGDADWKWGTNWAVLVGTTASAAKTKREEKKKRD